jgi:EthD domain
MSILKRRADVGSEKFASEWIDIHSFLVKRLPGVRGYTQNLIFDRAYRRGKPATYAELAIDGIVELWFSDLDSMSAGFASDAGETLMTHATEFIARSQLFL